MAPILKPSTVILTRYLYFLDECFYSLLMSLINKTSLAEVLFWTGEIYYSGFEEELWNHVWKIYYDFYAIKYPKFEKKINKLAKAGTELRKTDRTNCEEDIKNIIIVINLLYHSKVCYDVFLLRTLKVTSPSHAYIGKTPVWLKNLKLTKLEQHLIRSIHNDKRYNKHLNILFYLKYFKNDIERCYEIIKIYYNVVRDYALKDKTLESIQYTDKYHIILALICHLSPTNENIQSRAIYKKLNKEFVREQINFNNDKLIPACKILTDKRLYAVSPLIGVFDLKRHAVHLKHGVSSKDILLCYWDYFIYSSPLWKTRIDKYGGTIVKKGEGEGEGDNDHEYDYRLEFENTEHCEIFYNKYNYEPEKQTEIIINKSIQTIDKNMGQIWLKNICNLPEYKWVNITMLGNVY